MIYITILIIQKPNGHWNSFMQSTLLFRCIKENIPILEEVVKLRHKVSNFQCL